MRFGNCIFLPPSFYQQYLSVEYGLYGKVKSLPDSREAPLWEVGTYPAFCHPDVCQLTG
jgi:hypothetical protein